MGTPRVDLVGGTTLGDGAGGICVGVDAGTLGVGTGTLGAVGMGVGTGGTQLVVAGGMALEMILANCLRVCICASPMCAKGAAGVGCWSACFNAAVASWAASAEDVVSILQLCGNNLTMSAMRSDAVLVT
jgi:hypothetical protein